MKREDLSGRIFGRLTVLRFAGLNQRHATWRCVCSCGKEKTVFDCALKSGGTKSCGCWSAENVGNRSRTHGLSGTPEYKVWRAMFQRCEDESAKNYPRYGGRGISICKRWRVFENFIADMGARPSNEHSIDRINNNGNYEPSNCRWATREEQYANTSVLKPIGGFPSRIAACREAGISTATLASRLKRGLSVEEALMPHISNIRKAA